MDDPFAGEGAAVEDDGALGLVAVDGQLAGVDGGGAGVGVGRAENQSAGASFREAFRAADHTGDRQSVGGIDADGGFGAECDGSGQRSGANVGRVGVPFELQCARVADSVAVERQQFADDQGIRIEGQARSGGDGGSFRAGPGAERIVVTNQHRSRADRGQAEVGVLTGEDQSAGAGFGEVRGGGTRDHFRQHQRVSFGDEDGRGDVRGEYDRCTRLVLERADVERIDDRLAPLVGDGELREGAGIASGAEWDEGVRQRWPAVVGEHGIQDARQRSCAGAVDADDVAIDAVGQPVGQRIGTDQRKERGINEAAEDVRVDRRSPLRVPRDEAVEEALVVEACEAARFTAANPVAVRSVEHDGRVQHVEHGLVLDAAARVAGGIARNRAVLDRGGERLNSGEVAVIEQAAAIIRAVGRERGSFQLQSSRAVDRSAVVGRLVIAERRLIDEERAEVADAAAVTIAVAIRDRQEAENRDRSPIDLEDAEVRRSRSGRALDDLRSTRRAKNRDGAQRVG